MSRLQICVLYYMNIKYIFFSQDPLSVFLFNSVHLFVVFFVQVLAGSLSGSNQCLSAVRALHNILGGVVDPVSVCSYSLQNNDFC